MSHSRRSKLGSRISLLASLLVLACGVLGQSFFTASVYGAQLGNRRLLLSNNNISAVSDYTLSFNLSTAGTLGSILVQICTNDPLEDTVCIPPTGFDASAVVLASQTGPGDFSIDPASTQNEVLLTHPPSAVGAGPISFDFTGITNPSIAGPHYARVYTYAASDGTGPGSDYGGLAFNIQDSVAISALVPPFLTFCTGITITGLSCANASGNYLDLGELSSSSSRSGTSQMLVSTNAVDGYNVTMQGSTMASGTNFISNLVANDVSRPGTSQFGLNLRANAAPAVGSDPGGPGVASPLPNYNQPNSYRFVSGEAIIANSVPDDVRLYTASYLVNVPATQAPGIYVSTITYICLASF